MVEFQRDYCDSDAVSPRGDSGDFSSGDAAADGGMMEQDQTEWELFKDEIRHEVAAFEQKILNRMNDIEDGQCEKYFTELARRVILKDDDV